jgi:CMP-N-acetylneuraminic acid synthetase
MNILVTICARGGSKGIPGKNIRVLNGRPLLFFSINAGKQFADSHLAEIALSTDSEEIRAIAFRYGIQTGYSRPKHLADDSAGKIETIADILFYEENNRNKKYDYILDLDVTSPLRNLEDLNAAFEIIKQDPNALNLFSVNVADRNPYFNMVEQYPNGYYGLVKKGVYLTRQSAPKVFQLNASFYFFRRAFFDSPFKTALTESSLIYLMPHICFDLDHPIDFEFMEYLMANDKLGFKL